MALNINPITLQAVVEKASHDAANHPRWLQAIARAIVEISDNPFICRNPNGHGVIIGSTSGQAYSANGTCSCEAFKFGQPCYHRAIARIVRLCDERETAQRQIVCQQPDNLCELHSPCPEHAAQAAAYLQQEGADEGTNYEAMRQFSGAMNMSDMESDHMPALGDKLARARKALELVNELY